MFRHYPITNYSLMRHSTYLLLVLLAIPLTIYCDSPSKTTVNPILRGINYSVEMPLKMNMSDSKEIKVTLIFNENNLLYTQADQMTITFNTSTISPQFQVLQINGATNFTTNLMNKNKTSNVYLINLNLTATYIGHAILQPDVVTFHQSTASKQTNATVQQYKIPEIRSNNLHVIIAKPEGILDSLFIISVSIFIIITYINLGAQLDTENIKQMIKKPTTLILGLIISVIIMPLITWFLSQWLLRDQLIYRIGSFIFACGPAASASTLWAVMLDSDKELSVGLQVTSTIVALITMPILLYLMDTALILEGGQNYAIKVPYSRLIQTLSVLLIALFIGWKFVGQNPTAQKFSRKIFRPLTFSVLLFIIIFSSILYWHIYQMFDWNITLTSVLISVSTYLLSGLLGHLINCNKDHSIAISIGSTYKNSGIAFAVLLVAFEVPDVYIAFVPCLTQVITTSLILYIAFYILKLYKLIARRGQPDPIQATSQDLDPEQPVAVVPSNNNNNNTSTSQKAAKKETRSGSTSSGKSGKSLEENEELVAMNVTDVVPGSPVSNKVAQTKMREKKDPEEDNENGNGSMNANC